MSLLHMIKMLTDIPNKCIHDVKQILILLSIPSLLGKRKEYDPNQSKCLLISENLHNISNQSVYIKYLVLSRQK